MSDENNKVDTAVSENESANLTEVQLGVDNIESDMIIENKEAKINLINYLDPEILNVKTYSLTEADDISKENQETREYDEKIYNNNISNIHERTVIKGTVVAIDDKDVIVDIGFKSEGVINRNEFNKIPTLGKEIEVFLITFEDRKGRLILSKERADFEKRWQELRDAYDNDSVLTGKITKRIKGGMVVDLGVVNAFLPGSQLDVKTITDFEQFINMECELKIVKFNEFRQNIVVSRKAVMSTDLNDRKKEFLENIEVGMEIDGIVKNITDFGVFIDLGGGIDGLLHITDITWGRINHPSDRLSLGEQVKVKIIDYDKVKNRVSLGLKQLSLDPWTKASSKYDVDSKVKGKIVNIMNYGVFLEIEEGIEGLIHISEMSWYKHIKHPGDLYKIGDEIEAKVLSIDNATKKISLGIKQLEDDPWLEMENKFKVGETYKGKVLKFTQNGAFIEFKDHIYGFLQINDISWTRKIKHPGDILKKGDDIETQVLNLSIEDKKINLGLKQLTEDPWKNIENLFQVEQKIKGNLLLNLEKGVIFLLDHDFEGILPVSKIKSKNKMIVGNKYDLKIIEINEENRRIVLEPYPEENSTEEVEVIADSESSDNNDVSTKDTNEESSIKDDNPSEPSDNLDSKSE